MASPIDAQQDLENYFSVASSFGPFFVPFEKGFTYEQWRDAVRDRASSIYPLIEPVPAKMVYLRAITYEVERPKPGDKMIPYHLVMDATIEGLLQAGVIYDKKVIYGMWGFRDHMPDLPADMLVVQLAWGP